MAGHKWPAQLGEQSWEREGHPWRYTWVVRTIGGRPRVTHLAVEPSRYAREAAYLTQQSLSRVPLPSLASAGLQLGLGNFTGAAAEMERPQVPGRRGYDAAHWDRIWHLVQQAERQGVSALTLVQLAMPDRSNRTLKRWIAEARRTHTTTEEDQ